MHQHAFGVAIAALILAACSVSGPLPPGDKSLVPADAPIYDRSLQGVGLDTLNLENFWHERSGDRPHVVLHNRTFSDVASAVRDGVVNIYTRRV